MRREEVNSSRVQAVEYPLRNLLADIARNLWSNEVFIGVDVIDRLLFGVIHSGKGSYAVTAFFDLIQNAELHKPGFVLYPPSFLWCIRFRFLSILHETLALFDTA